MKTSIIEIPRLFDTKTDRTRKIIQWDNDNAFPYRYLWLADKSVTASSCIDLFSKFLYGEGWEDEAFGSQIVGPRSMTINDFTESILNQWAKHRGYAIVVGLNGLLEHSSYQVMPMERVRKGDQDKIGYFGVHEHWGKTGKTFRPQDIEWFPPYTEDPNIIMKYIEDAGSFEKFNGMMFYASVNPLNYPNPIYSSALEQIETEALIAIFQRRNASTGFMASHIFKFKEELKEDPTREEMEQMLNSFQGARNGSKIMLVDGVDEEDGQDVTIEKVDIQDVDRLFEYTEESSGEAIRKSFLIPKALIGHEESTGFDTERINQARSYYNDIVKWDRDKALRPIKTLVKNFERELKLNDNWKIKQLYASN